ncbi:MAG: CHAT domain-containing protein, partial [Planctomycetes bacterium]|nr:CHAT domain-containing protein [Planctomycetota bacterium]
LEPPLHPHFDITHNLPAEIPWEALEESYAVCENEHCRACRIPVPLESPPRFYCASCGARLRVTSGKLVFTRHITHHVRTKDSVAPSEGRSFLVVANPTEDLFEPERDPGGVCRGHIDEILRSVERAGYEPRVLQGKFASLSNVLEAIRDPSVVGLYYFGHGRLPDRGAESCLVLAHGVPLYDSQIEAAAPRLRFAFLNACHGAAMGQEWGLDAKASSVAHALAGAGPGRVVIAPLRPVLNTQAAAMALSFFRCAFRGARLAKALEIARRRSHKAYRAGAPDISWAVYRYFGKPDKVLPAPGRPSVEAGGGLRATKGVRVFAADGLLQDDVFSLRLDAVLLRAAKRRNLQGRRRVTVTDFVAGLVRKGGLTRFMLRRFGKDPDVCYEAIGGLEEREEAAPQAPQAAAEPDAADLWTIERRDQLQPELAEVLVRADALSAARGARGESPLICELDVLRALFAAGKWPSHPGLGLPRPEEVDRWLGSAEVVSSVDGDGCILIQDLDAEARKVIETAHVLAQQRGVCPITKRLVLAAFLTDAQGPIARLFKKKGARTEVLCAVLLALSKGDNPTSFPLSHEACDHAVLPIILRARALARSGGGTVSLALLFKAFCEEAPASFVAFLRGLPKTVAVDLPALAAEACAPPGGPAAAGGPVTMDAEINLPEEEPLRREHLSEGAWRLIEAAARWARLQGWLIVRNPHLFAALLGDGLGPLGGFLRLHRLEPEIVKQLALSLVPPRELGPDVSEGFTVSPTTYGILVRAVKTAQERSRRQASADDVLDAFWEEGGGVVGEVLGRFGVDPATWKPYRQRTANGGGKGGNGNVSN